MERKRKAYLLRKSDLIDHLSYNPQISNDVCSCNTNSSARSYDLQTQTITFEDDTCQQKETLLRNSAPILKKITEVNRKAADSCPVMDQDLEFYPVDDHPSPSTFTAWDAFLAGNQAFFREPPGLLPDPAFSYMDVIPEEDDMEALLESDTDDTGSSVSTVIDRFSRTSTANSSFSERCKGTTDVTFDLQKVLSPFERLEKELDANESKGDNEFLRRKISKGPIVVITNSSSCEDVHSADEEENAKLTENEACKTHIAEFETQVSSVNENSENDIFEITLPPSCKEEKESNSTEKPLGESDVNSPLSNGTKTPPVPVRSKIMNGSKSTERDRTKSEKKDSLPASAIQKKKSYPTPSVPPRMSKHLPARRTRSDPGTSDHPSRIPRPISNCSRSLSTNSTPKSNSKNNRSPKIGIPKKLKFTESPKSSRSASNPTINLSEANPPIMPTTESVVTNQVSIITEGKIAEVSNGNCVQPGVEFPSQQDNDSCNFAGINSQVDETVTTPDDTVTAPVFSNENIAEIQETLTAKILDLFPSDADFMPANNLQEEKPTNPFRNTDTNPFKAAAESKNPFVKCNNPFELSPEEIPSSQPNGQMVVPLIAPPIPERPSLKLAEKLEPREEESNEEYTETAHNVGSCNQETEKSEVSKLSVENHIEVSTDNPVTTTENIFRPTPDILEAIEITLSDMDIINDKSVNIESKPDILSNEAENTCDAADTDKGSAPQRPIEDILQALDQLVLSAPREVEISIDWGLPGPVNIKEKAVLPSDPSGDRSDIAETDGLTEDRKRDIETLLKEVDECLKLHKVGENLSSQQPTENNPLPASGSLLSATHERSSLGPGSLDAPPVGSTSLTLCQYDNDQNTLNSDALLEHSSPNMLKHQSQNILANEKRVNYSVPYQEVFGKTTQQLDEDALVSKHHSPGCDDSGVFLEDPIASSPETQSRSAANRLQNTLDKLSNDTTNMRHYSIHEALDSDAERSDDLGLASSSIDSADDLDGDPLPSALHQNCPQIATSRQKPPPIPARKSMTLPPDFQKNNRYHISEINNLEVPNIHRPPLSKSSSSGEESNFDQGDHCINESNFPAIALREKSKNILNQQKNEQSLSNFAMTRSYHEDMLLSQLRENNQDPKSNFLARTLNNPSNAKKVDVPIGNHSSYIRRNNEQSSGFKWKSEECLRTAAESKWSISGRRYEKSVSVKDRIAMFSEMEANQTSGKRDDLQRYGSENNIKAASVISESKKLDAISQENDNLKDSKWHSMHSINKKPFEKETTYIGSTMKPALSIPAIASNNVIDNISSNYGTLPVKLDVEPPKAIVSTYPETQLTTNKRYNYGLYSLKNLKNTENLLSKKVAGSNLLSIIDNRKQPTQKLKGLVIPDKPYQANASKELPTIVSSDSDGMKDSRRSSLPIAPVITTKAMSLPRNKKLECVPAQRQTSLTEPPWKNDSTNPSYTLPKYTPAFKKKSLELPGSSLSPTPPSSITSPMSPPPSSPSSICSSNASSTLQQNVFQFSLSHSKPVQPLQPEKALMSPPSLPSDVEYEGDNSEDSSHSASPMRHSSRNSKDAKNPTQQQTANPMPHGRSNTFTSSTKCVSHQPMMVETLIKLPTPIESETLKPKAAIYLSKTEILLKKDDPKMEFSIRDQTQNTLSNELISNTTKSTESILPIQDISNDTINGTSKDEVYLHLKGDISPMPLSERKNHDSEYLNEYYSKMVSSNEVSRNGALPSIQSYVAADTNHIDIQVGKFRALPVSLKESPAKSVIGNVQPSDTRSNKNHHTTAWGNGRPPHSECEESEDEDSHSTLSHRTEDSRHTTTDDCLSDATTDSFEKPRLAPEPPALQRCNDDNASIEGYLSDASTDVSLRRFTNRSFDSTAYSTEDYLSDATAESPDPDWVSNRVSTDYTRSKSYGKNYTTSHWSPNAREDELINKNNDFDLRPRRLSQQKTVLRAAIEPSGSVQKFKALAEKWEQRADVISPPPPIVVPVPAKKESKSTPVVSSIVSSTSVSNTIIKGKGTLPPSLMPRNSSSEKKIGQTMKSSKEGTAFTVRTTERETSVSTDGVVSRKPLSSTIATEAINGWNQHDEPNRLESLPRCDSTSSTSTSSKTTLKDEELLDSPPPLNSQTNGFDSSKTDFDTSPAAVISEDINHSNNQRSSQTRSDGMFNNEPRNRRGADFSRTNPIQGWPKSNRPTFGTKSTFSVSDIRRSFENGSKETEKPLLPPKKPPMPAARVSAPVTTVTTPPPIPTRKPSLPNNDIVENDDEMKMAADSARDQLHSEGVSNQFDVLTVILRREGEGGGSVGITLAGGADYEVKEITVHKVISGSIADRDGRVLKGDRVMSINSRDLRGVSHGEALHILKAPSPKVLLVLARDKSETPLIQHGTAEKEVKRKHDVGNGKDVGTINVELSKDATGLGFSIEGGKDSPQGDRPLIIKRIFKGGSADKDGQLEEGDEIISVNNQPVSNMTRTEAWNFLKKLLEGPILLKARKANFITA